MYTTINLSKLIFETFLTAHVRVLDDTELAKSIIFLNAWKM
jgi:hypothetical protein